VRNFGNDYELTKLRELASHWGALRNRSVPMFAVTAEETGLLARRYTEYWRPNRSIDLQAPPYSLLQLF
jgi:hypothetical protein